MKKTCSIAHYMGIAETPLVILLNRNIGSFSKQFDTVEELQKELGDLNYESFCVLLLNRANKVLKTIKISDGGITGTVVDQRKVFKLALDQNATSIILGHNHPSGQVTPSSADIDLTKKMKAAGITLDLPILDHIIVGDGNYYSFADEGII